MSSWFNINSLNTIKGQIQTFAQEVLAEAEKQEDENEVVNPFVALEECKKQNEELVLQCTTKDAEIAALKKQVALLEKNATTSLENSWICAPSPENPASESSTIGTEKNDHERNSESSSGGEMINIPLDTNTPQTLETESWEKIRKNSSASSGEDRDKKDQTSLRKLLQENSILKQKISQLLTENQELTDNIETLDSQHNIAIQEVLELKNDLQGKFVTLTTEYDTLKAQHEKLILDSQNDLKNLKEKLEARYEGEVDALHETIVKLEENGKSLKNACEAKDQHIVELLDKINGFENELMNKDNQIKHKYEEEIKNLKEQIENIEKEKNVKIESLSKQGSEDEFIVLSREGDNGAASPNNENWEKKYKDIEVEKIHLEMKISELEKNILQLQLENNEIQKTFETQLQERDVENVNLKSVIEKHTEFIKTLQTKHETLKNENVEFQEQIVINQKSLQNASEKILEYENKLKMSQSDLDKKIIQLENTIADLKQDKQKLEHQIEILKNSEDLNNSSKSELEIKLNEMKRKNDELENEIKSQKLKISELTETVSNCEANASDVESKLMMENVDLQKRIIDMESTANQTHTETITLSSDDSSNFEQIRKLLKEYLQIDFNRENVLSIETDLKNVQSKIIEIDSIKKDLTKLADEVTKLKSEISTLEHDKETLQADIVHYEEECEELMRNNEVLLNELENLKSKKLETISEKDEESIMNLEKQLEECNNLNRSLEGEYEQLLRRIEELETEKQDNQSELKNICKILENSEKTVKQLRQENSNLTEENCRLIFEINEMKTDDKKSAMESEINEFKVGNQNLEKQLERLSKDHADLVAAMQSQQSAFIEYKRENEASLAELDRQVKEKDLVIKAKESEIAEMLKTIKSLETRLTEQTEAYNTLTQHLKDFRQQYSQLDEQNNTLLQKCEELQTQKSNLETQYQELSQNVSDTTASNQNTLESQLIELQQTIEALTNEKNGLIQAVTLKHNENVQYYNEIQRLDQILKAEIEKSQQYQQQQQGQNVELSSKSCDNCLKLENSISETVKTYKIEIEKLNDQINFLKEKSQILTTNLLTEQTNQKLMQQEKQELIEKNSNLNKDLERLRQHLVELEESHTQETLEMQNIIDETKAKMFELQKEVANSSNAYTSASIRANQHAETLQAQYQLVQQQRDELAAKLSKAEDRESKNQAALVNLQCALEQFQKEKEKDILLETNRLRKELANEQEKQKQLQVEITTLNQQLVEANQGLLAATRLSNQLETSQITITSLKEQISKLEILNHTLEQKLRENETNQADKIEKSLVKSLIIGYIVSTNQNDKQQILKMISSILNFNQTETNKVGLNRNQSGWLSGFLHGNAPDTASSGGDGLVKAFVDFLEKESQPQSGLSTMPNLLNIVSKDNNDVVTDTNESVRERKISTSSTLSATSSHHHHHVQPILVNESVLDQFAPTRNSSSILKDILNDI